MDRTTLRRLVDRHAGPAGMTQTPIRGLRLFRIEEPIERLPTVYPASLCCVVQGTKHVYLGDATYTYDAGHYLCAMAPLPVESEVPFATLEEPVLGVMLDLDTQDTAETLVAYEAAAAPPPAGFEEQVAGMVLAEVDDELVTAVGRLVALLEDPVAVRVLASGRLRELLFTILGGEAGPLIRRGFGTTNDIAPALAYVYDHLGEALSVDDLARRAGMSRAVFHRRFKATTGFSPLQFIKALRLSHAAMRIVGGGAVSQAAQAVGYSSASQFSREFRRQFGQSPRQWAKTAAASAPDVRAALA